MKYTISIIEDNNMIHFKNYNEYFKYEIEDAKKYCKHCYPKYIKPRTCIKGGIAYYCVFDKKRCNRCIDNNLY